MTQQLVDLDNEIKSCQIEINRLINDKKKVAETLNQTHGLCVECLKNGIFDKKAEVIDAKQNMYHRLCAVCYSITNELI